MSKIQFYRSTINLWFLLMISLTMEGTRIVDWTCFPPSPSSCIEMTSQLVAEKIKCSSSDRKRFLTNVSHEEHVHSLHIEMAVICCLLNCSLILCNDSDIVFFDRCCWMREEFDESWRFKAFLSIELVCCCWWLVISWMLLQRSGRLRLTRAKYVALKWNDNFNN